MEMKQSLLRDLILIPLSLIFFIGLIEGSMALMGFEALLRPDRENDSSAAINLCESDPDHLEAQCTRNRVRFDNVDRDQIGMALGGSSLVWSVHPGETDLIQLMNRQDWAPKKKIFFGNLGAACKDSSYMLSCYEKLKSERHKYVLLYEGHNDVINVGYANTKSRLWMRRHSVWIRISKFLQIHSRLFSWASEKAYRADAIKKEIESLSPEKLKILQALIIRDYKHNYQMIINEAKEQKAKVILVTTISNLNDYMPGKGIQDFKPKKGSVGDLAYESFESGKKLFGEKKYDQALTQFIKAKDLDPQGSRSLLTMNQALRELARENSNVELVDLEKFFYEKFKTEGLGCNLFGTDNICDQMHPNLRAKQVMADQIVQHFEKLPDLK
jgi:lysophospholipase L1-like esterase